MNGFNTSFLNILKVFKIDKFNSLQKLALEEGLFDEQKDFAVIAKSRTGKSFLGALMIANKTFNFKENENRYSSEENTTQSIEYLSIFITPYHSSARDFYSLITNYFGWFLKPFIIFGDLKQAELLFRISKGNSPNVLIVTPESMQSLIRNDITREWLGERKVFTVIFDDVHAILGDASRGVLLVEINQFVHKKLYPRPPILVLSAKFENHERLKFIFGSQLNIILDKDIYESPQIETIQYFSPEEKQELVLAHLRRKTDIGISTLVFMPRISNIEEFLKEKGQILAESVSYDIDNVIKRRLNKIAQILNDLNYSEYALITNGIAMNHGRMDDIQRWFIDWAFRRRYIRVLFGTQTVAFGLNTPVEHIIITGLGKDEILTQSMIARAIWMRKGRGKPGSCVIFTKKEYEKSYFERIYETPIMPFNPLHSNDLSNLLVGMIGLGLVQNESDILELKTSMASFFHRFSTKKGLSKLFRSNPPIITELKNGSIILTEFGEAVLKSNISGIQAIRIINAIKLLASVNKLPKEFDVLLIMNYALMKGIKSQKKMTLEEKNTLGIHFDFALLEVLDNLTEEQEWIKAIEYTIILFAELNNRKSYQIKSKKSGARLTIEIKQFTTKFYTFLEYISNIKILDSTENMKTVIDNILTLLDLPVFEKIITDDTIGKEHSLQGTDLSFITFENIEDSIDAVLESDLTVFQKIQTIELLEAINSSTSAFIALLEDAENNPAALEVLEMACSFAKDSLMGDNFVKALKENGVIEGNVFEQVLTQVQKNVEHIKKKVGLKGEIGNILYSVVTGNFINASISGIKLLAPMFAKRKVDTKKMT